MKKIILQGSENWRMPKNGPSSKLRPFTATAILAGRQQTMCLVNLQHHLLNLMPLQILEPATPMFG